MSLHSEHSPQNHIPGPDESSVPELEVDQTIAPRPEEEIADTLRAKPDDGIELPAQGMSS